MLRPVKFDTLVKGMYDAVEPGDVPNGGWASARNYIPYNKRMNRRGGLVRFTLDTRGNNAASTSGEDQIVSVLPISDLHNAAAGCEDWALATISREGEVEFSNPAGSWKGIVTTGAAATVTSDEMPWRCIIRNNRVYAVRRDASRMRRIEGDVWRDAGRPAPSAAPTLGSPVDGSSTLVAGTYQVAYGYFDSETGYYGNPGPTAEVVVDAGDRIGLDDLEGKSTAFFATHIAVWCSQVDGQALFLATTVTAPDAPAVTFANITSPPVGQSAPSRNLQPSAEATWLEEWGERFWWAVGSKLHYSPIGEFEAYSDIQAIEFEKGSGSDISVIYSWGNKLVVGKRRKMFLMAGFDRSSWEKKPWATKLGCVAPHSMRNCEGKLIFKSEDGFAMSEDGEEPRIISNDTIDKYLEKLDTTREDLTYAEVWPEHNIYAAVFPFKAGEERQWGGIVYNWKDKAWAIMEFEAQPRALRLGYDGDGATRIFAVMNTGQQAFTLFEGDNDDGDVISARLLSGAPKLTEEGGFLASIHSIRALMGKSRWPITVNIYGDGNLDTPIASTTVNTEDDESWKRISIDNLDDPRLQLQVEIIYEGKDPFWISEWEWTVNDTKKHLGEF